MNRIKTWADLAPHGLGLALYAGPDPDSDTQHGSMLESLTTGLDLALADIGGIEGLPGEVKNIVRTGLRAWALGMHEVMFPPDEPKRRGRPRNNLAESLKQYCLVEELRLLRPNLSRKECCRRAGLRVHGREVTDSKAVHDYKRGRLDYVKWLQLEQRFEIIPLEDRRGLEDPEIPRTILTSTRDWARAEAQLAASENPPEKDVFSFSDLNDDWPEDV